MTNLNFAPGTIFHMDNLDALRGMNSNTIDLIATDPPFNTNRNREGVGGKYVDQWRWGDNVHYEWMDQMRERGTEGEALIEVVEAAMHAHSLNLGAFLCFMGVRLLEMKRVLKPTGSVYVHIDSTASHYVKAAMDAVFGTDNFRNHITWRRATAHNDANQYGRICDHILYYVHSEDSYWDGMAIATPKDEEQMSDSYPSQDDRGRYRPADLTGPAHGGGNGSPSTMPWKGYDVFSRGRVWSAPKTGRYAKWIEEHILPGYLSIKGVHDRLDALDKADMIHHPKKGTTGWPGLKRYAQADTGTPPQDLILRPLGFTNFDKGDSEYTGYPDQKRVGLYEKFILASCPPDGIVLDPFAGCGTTIVSAKKHSRDWVGIDRSDDARAMILCNLAGIKKDDLAKLRQKMESIDPGYVDRMLAKHNAHFTEEPPVRTDDGEMAAPALGQVYAPEKKAALFNKERMRQMLFDQFGPQCWGCNYEAPADAGDRQVRYLELDHINPKAQGGVDDLHNRGLCCPPCNQTKGMRYTMVGLRQEVLGRDWKKHPIDLVAAEKWCRQRIRDEKKETNP